MPSLWDYRCSGFQAASCLWNERVCDGEIMIKRLVLSGFLAALTGCSPTVQNIDATPPKNGCVGQIEQTTQNLTPVANKQLLQEAIGAELEGKLCDGTVLKATAPVKVYRVWDKEKPYSAFGRWWSLAKPKGSRDEYRKKNNICPEWSKLNVVSHCELKTGTNIVVGTGQSAQCDGMILDKSPENQVYVPNDTRNSILFVENCSQAKDWPAKGH